jgi:hypothetical protein
MMGETKSRRSPNNLRLALRECELCYRPSAWQLRREGISGVCWPHRSAIHPPVLIPRATGPGIGGPTTLSGEDSVVQDYIEQRLMNPDAAVILNKAELAKAIHEEADA